MNRYMNPETGKIVSEKTHFSIGGTRYPTGWLTNMTKGEALALGLEEYVPPSEPEPEPPVAADFELEPYQFHAMLEIAGMTNAVRSAVNNIADPNVKAVVNSKLERAKSFQRNDESVLTLAVGLGLSETEVDALWMQAKDL